MADLIKKIKIKKQDGTFTDYIPIGAEAKNISTSDGESVQEKINNIVYKSDIIDNLDSTDSEKPLSAKQGKILNDKINDTCELIFPKFMSNALSGDANLIKYKNKSILIDTYSAEQ